MTLQDFILAHSDDDTAALILGRSKWPDIDMDKAVTAIECRRKIRSKLPDWYAEPGVIYPDTLCAEQCSSSFTARYKAEVISGLPGRHGRVADLTGGLGVDSLAFSRCGAAVLYNEMDSARAEAAEHNFALLGAPDIRVISEEAGPAAEGSRIWRELTGFGPDVIYLDPARRSATGGKVFLLEECSPDILRMLPDLMSICGRVAVKISPMADISMAEGRLRSAGAGIEALHIVEYEGECKELLLILRRGDGAAHAYPVTIVSPGGRLTVPSDMESGSRSRLLPSEAKLMEREWLFEPGKALSKSGLFSALCTLAGSPGGEPCPKAGRSTHLYFPDSQEAAERVRGLGKMFRIRTVLPLCRQSMKRIAEEYPQCEVSARNIPLTSDGLRKKLHVRSGGDVHIFGIRVDFSGAEPQKPATCLIVTERCGSLR